MLTRLAARPASVVAALAASNALSTRADSSPAAPPALSYVRRERAARVLTIAAAVEPRETATALRLARSALRREAVGSLAPSERRFLTYTLKEGVARGVACAAGGGAAAYAILKIVMLIIPLVPSRALTRAAMSAVSFGAAVMELAAFPDITTVELLLMDDSGLGCRARKTIEEYNPHLLLLQTLDRHAQMDHLHRASGPEPDVESMCAASEFLDQEAHLR